MGNGDWIITSPINFRDYITSPAGFDNNWLTALIILAREPSSFAIFDYMVGRRSFALRNVGALR
jgi:hypothetical protein